MTKIAVITDTDSSLPPQIAAQHGIQLVPITIEFAGETFTSGVDIDDALLFEKIDRQNKLPTTSAPSPSAFTKAYEAAFAAGADAVLCICVSSKVSSTYSSALTACESFPGRSIAVIDSLTLSMGQGFMALAAAEAAQQDASLDEVEARARALGDCLHVFAVVPTLKYLALSGRVGKLMAGMADTLDIKPVLTVREGSLGMLERVRTRKKAVERMLELVRQALAGKAIDRLAIIHVNNEADALSLQKQICVAHAYTGPVIVAPFTPGLSVHAGSGVVGVVIQSRPR